MNSPTFVLILSKLMQSQINTPHHFTRIACYFTRIANIQTHGLVTHPPIPPSPLNTSPKSYHLSNTPFSDSISTLNLPDLFELRRNTWYRRFIAISISTQCEEIVDHQAVKYDGGAVRRSKLFPFTLFFFNLLFIMLNENEFESVKGSGGCVDAVSAAIETLEHHCRNCDDIFCDKCTQGRIALTAEENAQQVRVCDQCMAEVTQRLSHVNEVAANKASGFNRHKDLAKKLQEEMEKKRRATESKSNVANLQMKDVECPTCTVHLQVEVPVTG
ncbi:hypothetical protein LXL04_006839 [Taraxacum kok-saghyz]